VIPEAGDAGRATACVTGDARGPAPTPFGDGAGAACPTRVRDGVAVRPTASTVLEKS
jgi:hypothetical protein